VRLAHSPALKTWQQSRRCLAAERRVFRLP
jgi:hypothetical protein